MRLRNKLLSGAAVVVGTATMALAGAASGGSAMHNTRTDNTPQAKAVREAQTGPRTRMPDGAPSVMIFWRNGQFHTVHLPPLKVFRTAGGAEVHEVGDASTPALIESQLPPVDHSLDNLHPTAAQSAAAMAASNAEQQKLNDAAAPLGPRLPAGPESTAPGPAAP